MEVNDAKLQRVAEICDRLEDEYLFECEAGPLKNCVEWLELREMLGVPKRGNGELRYMPPPEPDESN